MQHTFLSFVAVPPFSLSVVLQMSLIEIERTIPGVRRDIAAKSSLS